MKLPQKKQDELRALSEANNALVTVLAMINANTLKLNQSSNISDFMKQMSQISNLYDTLEKAIEVFTDAGNAFYDNLAESFISQAFTDEIYADFFKFFEQFGGTPDDE